MGLKNHLDSARGDDVVHRLSGGPNLAALAQAMNNVGKAIRIRNSVVLGSILTASTRLADEAISKIVLTSNRRHGRR